MLVHWTLVLGLGWLAAVAWHVALLYATLGFRQFSHHFTTIRDALEDGDEALARELLAQWRQVRVGEIPRSEIVCHAIEHSMIAAHRHVFGVFFWFLVPIGPAGVVLYRGAEYLARHWSDTSMERSPALGLFARQAFFVIDYIPARLTAIGFSIVGNFEDAVYAWRNRAAKWNDEVNGILLAAGLGALLGPRLLRW